METNPLTMKGFLTVGGFVLILVGLLSFILPGSALLGDAWWFDTAEGYAHILLGAVALAAAFAIPESLHKPLITVVGIVALFFGLYGFILPAYAVGKGFNTFGVANLESPLDNILHLFVAAWALYTAFMAKGSMAAKKL